MLSQTDALLPSTSEWCRAGVSQVAVAGDRWWDADRWVRVSPLVFIERNVGRKLNIL